MKTMTILMALTIGLSAATFAQEDAPDRPDGPPPHHRSGPPGDEVRGPRPRRDLAEPGEHARPPRGDREDRGERPPPPRGDREERGERPPPFREIRGEHERPPQARGERPGRFVPPLFAALDANHDGVIDAEEMANATAALKKLDLNCDGKLTRRELRPQHSEEMRGEPRHRRELREREEGDRAERPDRPHHRPPPPELDREDRPHHRPAPDRE